MTRLTHRERSQNRRVIVVGLLCMLLLIGIGATSRANAAPATPATTTAASTAQFEVPHAGWRFYYNRVCIRDQTWGSFYPAVIHTIANQLDGPRDLDTDYFSIEYPDYCANAFQDRQIVRVGLVPSENAHLYSWCSSGLVTTTSDPSVNGLRTHSKHAEVYWNYYKAECRDTEFAKRSIARKIGQVFGLQPGYYGSAYSVMNLDRFDIPWLTANDLAEFNDVY